VSNTKNLFNKNDVQVINNRINDIQKNTTPKWGQMDASQMFAHCCEVIKKALRETQQKRKLIGYIAAPFFKYRFYDSKPYKKKGGASTFVIENSRNFENEKQNLILLIRRFHTIDRRILNKSNHPILGKFTPEQWAIGQYKHLDHHLRQFGV